MNLPHRAVLLPLAAALPLGCVDTHLSPNEHHCAHQLGDQSCAELHPDGSRPFCLRGYCDAEAEPDTRPLDGCVVARPTDDACYSPCGRGSSLPDDASCLVPAASTTTDPTTTDREPSTTDPDPQPVCGDAIVDLDEACDDGELNGEPGRCALDCQGPTQWCGDGLLQHGEACDDGNATEGDGCNPDCRASGTVAWERELIFQGFLSAVDVAPDGAVYLAGAVTSSPTRAWAARLDARDGMIDWAYTLDTPADAALSNAFFAVQVLDDDLVAFAGRVGAQAYVVLLDETGAFVDDASDPYSTFIQDIADVGNGYLAKRGETVVHYNYALSSQWTADVGNGLAYRADDAVALAAPSTGASFRRFTLDGTPFAPVQFWLPMGFTAESRRVAWTVDGEVVVAGQLTGWEANDAFVIRSSSGGQLRWLYGVETLGRQHRYPECLTLDTRDAVIIGGRSTVLAADRPSLLKLSPAGDPLWDRSLEFTASTGRIYGCATNAANEILAVGESDGHMWLAKVTP